CYKYVLHWNYLNLCKITLHNMTDFDFLRNLNRLDPQDSGDPQIRHRTGVVDAVNNDGTVDLDLGGTVIPDVSVIGGGLAANDVVQVLTWKSGMLVLGKINPTNASVIFVEDGSESAPGLAFGSDPDTGFYRPSANQI